MMDNDEDGPPMLVAADGNENEAERPNAETDDVKITKVPITIITGM